MELKVRKMHPDARLPEYRHPGDAGMDLYAYQDLVLPAGEISTVSTGIQLAVPADHVGLIWDKSGLSLTGLHCLAGVVDAGYRGEIGVVLTNLSSQEIVISKGMRIAQMLIQPVRTATVVSVSDLEETARGAGGFGSTGLH